MLQEAFGVADQLEEAMRSLTTSLPSRRRRYAEAAAGVSSRRRLPRGDPRKRILEVARTETEYVRLKRHAGEGKMAAFARRSTFEMIA
jgi:hypothetical protein